MSDRSPTLADVINTAISTHLKELRVSLPGKIVSFDDDDQTATVTPLLKENEENADGDITAYTLGDIHKVPVVFPSGGGYTLRFPVAAGDPCLVVFSDRALDQWFDKGTDVDPIDLRRHDINDAICFVGLRSKAAKLAKFDMNSVELGTQDGPQVRVTGSEVHLGGDSGEDVAQFAAMSNKVEDALSTLKSVFDGWTPVPQDGGAALKAALSTALVNWPGSVAATKVKVK